MKKGYYLLLFFCILSVFSQNNYDIKIRFEENFRKVIVEENLIFRNKSSNTVEKIYLNDWNHAFSSKVSYLGNRFSDEFNRNFMFSKKSERGYTQINSCNYNFKRVENKIDIIEVIFNKPLQPNETSEIKINYEIYLPESKFNYFGYSNTKVNLKNCFLTVCKQNKDGTFVTQSEYNADDIFLEPSDFKITIDSSGRIISTDLKEIDGKFIGKNKSNFNIILQKESNFLLYKTPYVEIVSNLSSRRVEDSQKALIINKVSEYLYNLLGKSKQERIIVTQDDYNRDPLYGLNELPEFISPFSNDFLFELKFLKSYTFNYLRDNTHINYRENQWILEGIQYYILKKYIDDNYPNLKVFGKLSEWKILKGYKTFNMTFTEQFLYNWLLTSRRNNDQPLEYDKDQLIKFNERISHKYKAGLMFNYLNSYDENNVIEKSTKDILSLGINKEISKDLFLEKIKEHSSKKDIELYMNEMVTNNFPVDYKIHKVKKGEQENEVFIENKSKINLPIQLFTFKDNQLIQKKWLESFSGITSIKLPNNFDRVSVNENYELTEFDANNNFFNFKNKFWFKRPLKFQLIKDFENPKYNQIFIVPSVSYNLYDGLQPSISFNNSSVIDKLIDFKVTPAYSSLTKKIIGTASLAVTRFHYNNRHFSSTYGIGMTTQHYAPDAQYFKISPYVNFRFRNPDLKINERESVFFRQVFINRDQSNFLGNIKNPNYTVFNGRYNYSKNEFRKTISYGTDFQLSSGFNKVTGSFFYRKLFENNRFITVRGFLGAFLYNDDITNYKIGLDRPVDLLFDANFIGRSESSGLFSQQYFYSEGGFKSMLKDRFADQYMLTVNTTFNIWNWIEVYGDVGTLKSVGNDPKYLFDSGLHFNFLPDYFQLFLPVYSSNGFEMQGNDYGKKIRFVITLSPDTLISLFTRRWF